MILTITKFRVRILKKYLRETLGKLSNTQQNVAIGSGIIGLGSVAASMGYVAYIAFNIFVVIISIFTLLRLEILAILYMPVFADINQNLSQIVIINIINYRVIPHSMEGPFRTLFCRDSFCTVFARSKKQKRDTQAFHIKK